MNNNLRRQIYNSFNLKETDELVKIWQTNDRVQWSDDAFTVLAEVLRERLGELPTQNEPILEYEDTNHEGGESGTDLEFLIDDKNPSEFYDPHEILQLEKWLYKAAIASIIASVIASLLELPRMQSIVLSYFRGNLEWNLVAWLIAILIFVFAVGLQSIILYFPLKALGSILKILMEMEFNSRGIQKTKNA